MRRHKLFMGASALVLAASGSMALGPSAFARPPGRFTATPDPVTARDGIIHFKLVGKHLPGPGTYTLESAQLRAVCLSQDVDGTSITPSHTGHFSYKAEASTCTSGSYVIALDQSQAPHWTFLLTLTIT
jgi:hypothetical protein